MKGLADYEESKKKAMTEKPSMCQCPICSEETEIIVINHKGIGHGNCSRDGGFIPKKKKRK